MKLQGLDHIAISVSDPAASAAWYQDVLGLERQVQDVWGDVPIFMTIAGTGVAIFPADAESRGRVRAESGAEFRHVAFRTDREGFDRARRELEARGIRTEFQDHRVAQSIYFDDPDGFHLEIITYDVSKPENQADPVREFD